MTYSKSGFASRGQIQPKIPDFFSFLQVDSVKTKRFFVTCFDTTPDFFLALEFQKQGVRSKICIKYLEVAFNKEANDAEFFLEFSDQVLETDLEKCLQAQGAKGVNLYTFPNDGGKAATSSLHRIFEVQNKSGLRLSRGERPSQLVDRLAPSKTAVKDNSLDQEFNEKISAAEKISYEDFKNEVADVKEEVQVLGEFQKGIKDDVQSIGNDVQSYGVKMEAGFEDVKQGVCSVMPELHERIKQLEKEVEYHKTQRNIQEGKTARQTRRVNEKDEVITALQNREEAVIKREEGLLKRIKELESILLIAKTIDNLKEITQLAQEDRAFAKIELAELKQSIADAQENAKALGDVLAQEEERAAKRQRV